MKEIIMQFENETLYSKFLDLVNEQLTEQEKGKIRDTFIEFNKETNTCLVKESNLESL